MRYEVSFVRKSPGMVVIDRQTPFDGILSYFAYCENKKKYPEHEAIRQAQEQLPLKKYIFENDFFYMASIPEVTVNSPVEGFHFCFANRISNPDTYRTMGNEFVEKLLSVKKLQLGYQGTGPYKTWIVPVKVSYFNKITYVVEVEDKRVDEFFHLVNRIRTIGKYARFGFGRFDRCTVTETDRPIVRYVPVSTGIKTGGSYLMTSIRPPYWKGETRLCGLASL